MALRVFVSHSSQEDRSVLDAIAKAIDAHPDLTLLMDTENLRIGDPWRARINLWLGACDAAVLVLSEQALTKPWVLYEAAILSYRNRGDKFLILPVLLNDPEAKLLKHSSLDAPHISETQAIRKADPADIANDIVQRLAHYSTEEKRPIDAAVSRILTILNGLPTHLREEAAKHLKLKLPWEPGTDPLVPFAEQLLGATVEEAIDALLEIQDFLARDPKGLKTLLELVAASWVDPKAVEELPEIARASSGRAVALNAALATTARMYQVAACPTNRSHFISCSDVFAEPAQPEGLADEFVAKVERAIASYMTVPATEVRTKLKIVDRLIIFVAVPAIGMTDAVIERLQLEFPTILFFFLTGKQKAPPGAIERKLLKEIVPQLQDAEEDMFNANRVRLVAYVEESLGWRK